MVENKAQINWMTAKDRVKMALEANQMIGPFDVNRYSKTGMPGLKPKGGQFDIFSSLLNQPGAKDDSRQEGGEYYWVTFSDSLRHLVRGIKFSQHPETDRNLHRSS